MGPNMAKLSLGANRSLMFGIKRGEFFQVRLAASLLQRRV